MLPMKLQRWQLKGEAVLNEGEIDSDSDYDKYMTIHVQYRLNSGYAIAVEPYFDC